MTKYKAHGDYSLSHNNQTIFVEPVGAMNAEAGLALVADILILAKSLSVPQWALCIDARRWILGTPEFQEKTKAGIEGLIAHGLTRTAYVLELESVQHYQVANMMPVAQGYKRRYFPEKEAALEWLASQGFDSE
ncbi:MAG: hypothetical protein GJ680_06310 [Alteromonadaceae bacterium]|nr:hypothetical protein [Alteromonadaceae bacterium]